MHFTAVVQSKDKGLSTRGHEFSLGLEHAGIHQASVTTSLPEEDIMIDRDGINNDLLHMRTNEVTVESYIIVDDQSAIETLGRVRERCFNFSLDLPRCQ